MKFKKIILLFLIIFSLSGCSSDALSEQKRNGQFVKLDYEQYSNKILNGDNFILFLTTDGCSGCEKYYPEIASVLKENSNLTFYNITLEDLEGFYYLTFSSFIRSAVGVQYFIDNDLNASTLYTPSTIKVRNGMFESVNIGSLGKDSLLEFLQDNYYHYNYYYSFARKLSFDRTSKYFFSKEYDSNYDDILRTYFLSNDDKKGYYVDYNTFSAEEINMILEKINDLFDEDNKKTELSDYFYLGFEDGNLVDYQEVKFDEEGLNNLYANN